MICFRENANSCWVSEAALSAALFASASRPPAGSDGESFMRARDTFPMMAVNRLLKSCATPPARRPTASIFIACCSCARSFSLSSSDCLRPVMSRKDHNLPITEPRSIMGIEYRSRIRPSLKAMMSLPRSAVPYSCFTFRRKASGSTSCSSTNSNIALSSPVSAIDCGMRQSSRNLLLKKMVFPAPSTARMPSSVESRMARIRSSPCRDSSRSFRFSNRNAMEEVMVPWCLIEYWSMTTR